MDFFPFRLHCPVRYATAVPLARQFSGESIPASLRQNFDDGGHAASADRGSMPQRFRAERSGVTVGKCRQIFGDPGCGDPDADPALPAPVGACYLVRPNMQTTDIRKGLKIQIDGVPYHVVEHQFVKPGKGQSFTRCRVKNLVNGNVIERTWKSGEGVELADVESHKMTYSWMEADTYVFMDTSTGDQIHVEKNKLGDESRFLTEGLDCEVTLFNGNAIGVELPASVVMQITSSEPGIKGDTASGATKPATIASGATVNVPLFIKEGEWIKVDTSTGQYLERVNK